MPKPVIKIENLSKLYRLGEIGTGTISHDLNRWWSTKVRGKEDPFAKVGQLNDRTSKAEKGEHVWALKDINLEVNQGDIVGIIGKNGAGKSTLLKLLSRVTSPTTGTMKVKGRMASLLEVGTGFHPEMTGRENIYMNGTIMGLRRWEIHKKLDEIVDFAGVAKYLDTPTKRYSSGMTVRLGFAIAAILEPEILVVDEVLAVGDAEFQKKAIGKMQDVSQGEGRTVLFVSHNMASIQKLCPLSVLLSNGTVTTIGKTENVIQKYLEVNQNQELRPEVEVDNLFILNKVFISQSSIKTCRILMGQSMELVLEINNYDRIKSFSALFIDEEGNRMFNLDSRYYLKKLEKKKDIHTICYQIESIRLLPGIYNISIFFVYDEFIAEKSENIISFGVYENALSDASFPPNRSKGLIFEIPKITFK